MFHRDSEKFRLDSGSNERADAPVKKFIDLSTVIEILQSGYENFHRDGEMFRLDSGMKWPMRLSNGFNLHAESCSVFEPSGADL
jgi:hypothetical protein